jgi:starch synthase (maltosyl-transferring)
VLGVFKSSSDISPGSSYAIGSPQGGHDAIHPALGTFEDFARLLDAAATHGLEIALDFAARMNAPWAAMFKPTRSVQ